MSIGNDHIKKIREIVKKDLSKHFDRVKIFKIEVQEDVGVDEEEILRINVIFDGEPKSLNAQELVGTVRRLRPKLDKIEESAFPLLSFISKSEYNTARAS